MNKSQVTTFNITFDSSSLIQAKILYIVCIYVTDTNLAGKGRRDTEMTLNR